MAGARSLKGLAVLAIAAAAGIVFAQVGWPAEQYRHNDFAGFWVGSRLLLDGRDPYDFAAFLDMHQRIGSRGFAINPPGTAYGYPLTAALLFAPFALFPITLAAPLWLVTQVSLALAALVGLARHLFGPTLRRDLPVVLAFAISCQPAWLLAAGGNLGGYLLAIAAASATLLLAGRPAAAGAVAGLLIVKPHPLLIALPLILLLLPRRSAVRMLAGIASVAGAIVFVTLLLQPGWMSEFLVPFGRIGGAPVPRSTIFGLLGGTGPVVWVIVAALLAAFFVWARKGQPLPVVIGAAVPVSLLAIPYGWSYDHLLLLLTAAVILAVVASARARARAAVLFLLAIALIPLPWLLYAIAFRRGDESWSAIVPLGVLATLAVATRVAPSWRDPKMPYSNTPLVR